MQAEELIEALGAADFFAGYPEDGLERVRAHLAEASLDPDAPGLALVSVWVDPTAVQGEGAWAALLADFAAGSFGALAPEKVDESAAGDAVALRFEQAGQSFQQTLPVASGGPVEPAFLRLLRQALGGTLAFHLAETGWGGEGGYLLAAPAAYRRAVQAGLLPPAVDVDASAIDPGAAPLPPPERKPWVDIDEEWAYWINPETFRMPRIKGGAPVDTVVLVKRREEFVVTEYFEATPEGLSDLSKKEASAKLGEQMLTYMRRHGMYPPGVAIKRAFKNGNVDLAYAPGSYDSFVLRFSPEQVGGEVVPFLDGLRPYLDGIVAPPAPAARADRGPEVGPDWRIEPAKSGRAKCRTCSQKIAKGALRLGQPDWFEDRLSFRWHHLACIPVEDVSVLEGFATLSAEQQAEAQEGA